jgi:hypothetical protein
MGNDPVNNVDPTGGFIGPGVGCAATAGMSGFGGMAGRKGSGLNIGSVLSTVAAISGMATSGLGLINTIGQQQRTFSQIGNDLGSNGQRNRDRAEDDNQSLNNILITVTNEVVGKANTFSYPYSNSNDPKKLIRYEIPIYKVTVSGTDENGNDVSMDLEAIRFGVKNVKSGQAKDSYMQGIESGTFSKAPWDPSYQPHSFESNEKGAWVVKGNYLIHDGPDPGYLGASNGCVEILNKGGFNKFNDFIISLSGSKAPTRGAQLNEIGQKGLVTIKYEQAKVPPLKIFKKPQ